MVPSWQTAAGWTRAGICRAKRHEQLLFYTCGGRERTALLTRHAEPVGGTRAGNDSLSPQRARVRSPASSTGLSRAEGAWAQRWWRDGSIQVSVLNAEHGRSTIYLNKYLFKKERKPVFIQLLHLLAHEHTSSVTPARVGYTCIHPYCQAYIQALDFNANKDDVNKTWMRTHVLVLISPLRRHRPVAKLLWAVS